MYLHKSEFFYIFTFGIAEIGFLCI